MDAREIPKPLSAAAFESFCVQARNAAVSHDESWLLHSLCRTIIEDLGDPELACPPIAEGMTALMDAILCDYLVHRYERENSFDPFPIIQRYLFAETEPGRRDWGTA